MNIFQRLLFLFLLISQTACSQKFSPSELWKERRFSIPTQVEEMTLPVSNSEVTITIKDSIIAPIYATQWGVNSNFRSTDEILNRSELYQCFGSLRYPAGSGSNQYFWDCNIEEYLLEFNAFCSTDEKFLDPLNFIQFKKGLNAEVTIVVNYMLARYAKTAEGTRASKVLKAAKYAADFVKYMNVQHQADIKFWEIGNECYGKWETGFDVNGSLLTGTEYGEDFKVFYHEMKKVDANIKIGAVLWHKQNEWNTDVLAQVANTADFLIVHHYFDVNDVATANEAVNEIITDMQNIQSNARQYTNLGNKKFPVAFTEFNIQGDYVTTMLNGQFVADAIGTMIQEGFFLNTIWVNEWNIQGNDTKGILSLNDTRQPDFSPRPAYTPYFYMNKYFGDQLIYNKTTGQSGIKTFTTKFSSGEIGMLIINYNDTDIDAKINLPNQSQDHDLFLHSVHAEDTEVGTTKFYINNQTGTYDGGGPNHIQNVKPLHAKITNANVVRLPKHSCNYLALKQSSVNTKQGYKNSSIKISPNPGSNLIEIVSEEKIKEINIMDNNGKVVLQHQPTKQIQNCHIDTSSLPKGQYLIQVNNSDEYSELQWIKI